MSADLTKMDVLRYLLEEYFKDGILEEAERENIKLIRETLDISQKDYLSIFLEVDAKYKSGKLVNDGTDVAGSNIKVYRRILEKALNDGVIKEEEEELYRIVATTLLISGKQHSELFGRVIDEKNLSNVPELVDRGILKSHRVGPFHGATPDQQRHTASWADLTGIIDLEMVTEVGCNLPLILVKIAAFRDRNELILVYTLQEANDYQRVAEKILSFMEGCFSYIFFYSQWIYLGFGNPARGITFGEMKCPKEKVDLLTSIDPDAYQIRFEWRGLDGEECSITFFHKRRIDFSGELYRGIKCFSNGENKMAIAHLQKALKNDSMIFGAHYYTALCQKSLGNSQVMEEFLLEEIQITPDFHEVYLALGRQYLQTGQKQRALTHLERSLDYKTFDPETIGLLLELYIEDHERYETQIMEFLAIGLFLLNDDSRVLSHFTSFCNKSGKRIEDLLSRVSAEFNPVRDKLERLFKASVLMYHGHYGLTAKFLETCVSMEGLAPPQTRFLKNLLKRVFLNRYSFLNPKVKTILKPVHDLIQGKLSEIFSMDEKTEQMTRDRNTLLIDSMSDTEVTVQEEPGDKPKKAELICPRCGKAFPIYKKPLFKLHVSICQKRITGL